MRPQPISALWGVGAAVAERLERIGARTVGDVADLPHPALEAAVGAAGAATLHALANGIDPREVTPTRLEKSIGHWGVRLNSYFLWVVHVLVGEFTNP